MDNERQVITTNVDDGRMMDGGEMNNVCLPTLYNHLNTFNSIRAP